MVLGKQPSLLIPSCSSTNHGGGDKRSTRRGPLVVDVIGRCVDDSSIILYSPACLCMCNDEDNF